jgi:hypothetical protein
MARNKENSSVPLQETEQSSEKEPLHTDAGSLEAVDTTYVPDDDLERLTGDEPLPVYIERYQQRMVEKGETPKSIDEIELYKRKQLLDGLKKLKSLQKTLPATKKGLQKELWDAQARLKKKNYPDDRALQEADKARVYAEDAVTSAQTDIEAQTAAFEKKGFFGRLFGGKEKKDIAEKRAALEVLTRDAEEKNTSAEGQRNTLKEKSLDPDFKIVEEARKQLDALDDEERAARWDVEEAWAFVNPESTMTRYDSGDFDFDTVLKDTSLEESLVREIKEYTDIVAKEKEQHTA